MEVEEKFVVIAGLICEPVRAKMLWCLLDGRAYTASELAIAADISATSASNHLLKLREADMIKMEIQGRHRYYAFSRPEVAYAVESLATLAGNNLLGKEKEPANLTDIQFCRTCYDHLAGFVGVKITDALQAKGYLSSSDSVYEVTDSGWNWLERLEITEENFNNNRRPLTRQCLDWSERRPHLAGQLGASILEKMLAQRWFKKNAFSRALAVTAKGRQELRDGLGVDILY